MNKLITIQAILTIDSEGNYNICGWNNSPENRENQIDHMKCISEEGLDYSTNPKKQFLIEQVIELPNFELPKIDVEIKDANWKQQLKEKVQWLLDIYPDFHIYYPEKENEYDGDIRLEKSDGDFELSVEFDFDKNEVYIHNLNMKSKEYDESFISLNKRNKIILAIENSYIIC